jgi:hypothetical protein
VSTDLAVYQLDLVSLRAVQGGQDWSLAERVLSENAARIHQHDRFYQSKYQPYWPLGEAVAAIVSGKVDSRKQPLFQFEHAAALIAATLGDPLDAGVFMESTSTLWSDVEALLEERLSRAGEPTTLAQTLDSLLDRGPYLDVPIDQINPLGTGYLLADEVNGWRAAFAKMDLDETGVETLPTGVVALEALRTVRDWLDAAAHSRQGLFFHA